MKINAYIPLRDEQSRLRLFLEEYERVCKRYSLLISSTEKVVERIDICGNDYLPEHLAYLKKGGINT